MTKRRKLYAFARHPLTGRRMLAHRLLAEQTLGRPLRPGEVVHHRDGNSLNNDLVNLIVLPSQRVHAHAEFHARRHQSGMPSLFPELFQTIPDKLIGGLFDYVLIWQGQEPPLQRRPQKATASEATMPHLFADFDLALAETDLSIVERTFVPT